MCPEHGAKKGKLVFNSRVRTVEMTWKWWTLDWCGEVVWEHGSDHGGG